MSAITRTDGNTQSSQARKTDEPLRGLDMDHFLTLMITELQNQDPLNPMDNAQILQQISQIREIGATTEMQETLEAVLLGQNLNNASGLINKHVAAMTDDGKQVQGVVERVTVAENNVQLTVDGVQVALSNVSEILP